MRIAWRVGTDEKVSAEQFIKEIGRHTIDPDDPAPAGQCYCKVCGSKLSIVASNKERITHFRHPPRINCPVTTNAGRPYLNLEPLYPDQESGARLRRQFRRNWRFHYSILRGMVPLLSITEFTRLLSLATDKRSWEYQGLNEHDIPRLLVILADFPPHTSFPSGKRDLWFRFWYEHGVTCLDELWIRPNHQAALFRGSFLPPATRRGRPAYSDLQRIADESDWTNHTVEQVPDGVVRAVERWFNRRTGLFPLE